MTTLRNAVLDTHACYALIVNSVSCRHTQWWRPPAVHRDLEAPAAAGQGGVLPGAARNGHTRSRGERPQGDQWNNSATGAYEQHHSHDQRPATLTQGRAWGELRILVIGWTAARLDPEVCGPPILSFLLCFFSHLRCSSALQVLNCCNIYFPCIS